ncbi:MAG: nucleoside deaminase [Saprospiraceae bacterium]
MLSIYTDEYFMKQAILEAQKAAEKEEIPVGAVIVCQNKIIARAHNQTEKLRDVTAHAEMLAITAASEYLGNKYLTDCILYVTLEPCIMCAGALHWSQLAKIVYGAGDEKRGFMRFGKTLLHPTTKVEFGVSNEECRQLMIDFFAEKRKTLS